MHRTTLRDVANAAKVSVTTASLILNGRPARVAEETRARVERAARDLQYIPNQNARSLVTNKSLLIALIVPDIENLFFASLAKQLEDWCAADGYSLIISNSDDSRNAEHALISRLSALDIDGILLIPARESYEALRDLKADVKRLDCPVMLLDRMFSDAWCDGVGIDNRLGGQLAAQCLLDEGHVNIACITGGTTDGNGADRVDGFRERLEEARKGGTDIVYTQLEGDFRFASGYEAADTVLDSKATAVFCCNDLMGAGFMQRCAERNVMVPEDISVIGYDNILSRYGLFRDITSVDQGIDQLAQAAWQRMLERIETRADAIQEQKKQTAERVRIAREAIAGGHVIDEVAEREIAKVVAQIESDGEIEAARTIGKPWLDDPETVVLDPQLVMRSTVGSPAELD